MILLVSITSVILIIWEVILDGFRNFRARSSRVRDIGTEFGELHVEGVLLLLLELLLGVGVKEVWVG